MYQHHMLLKIRNICSEVYTLPDMIPMHFSFFKHLKTLISIKVPVTLPQTVYICMRSISPNSVS